jgi:cell shape-determining protein MreC
MASRRVILGVIVATTALLAGTNLGAWVWAHSSRALKPLQVGMAPRVAPPADEEAAALREQVIRLNAENVVLRTRLAEYQSIKGEGGVPPEQAVVVRGRIISRTQRAGRRYCELDAGAIDGVAKGMPACSGWSLVGVVVGVQDGRCLVQEVSDSESRIPAAIVDAKRKVAEGVAVGKGHPRTLGIDYVEEQQGVEISPGMQVVTAGADGRLPAGLVLGTVTAATRGGAGDHWSISFEPVRSTDNVESLVLIRFAPPQR